MFFSVIVVSLNAQDLITSTIESVLNQSFSDYEIVVKDGESKDETISKIPHDQRIVVISQKDCGIYDAMNQAIKVARGEYLIFLNCGDNLHDSNVFQSAYNYIQEFHGDIVYGDYSRDDIICKMPNALTSFYMYCTTICHQATFFRRQIFDEMGNYDKELRIAADWKFFVRARKANYSLQHMDLVVCNFLPGGVSETDSGKEISSKERRKVVSEEFSLFQRLIYGFGFILVKSKAGKIILKLRRKWRG